MANFEGDWTTIPAFVDWVRELESWTKNYSITRYVPSDGLGEDPTGALENTDPHLVWTLESADQELIQPGFHTGDWGEGTMEGWFIGALPWVGSDDIFVHNPLSVCAELHIPCPECSEPESEEIGDGCEMCDFSGDIFLHMDQVDYEGKVVR